MTTYNLRLRTLLCICFLAFAAVSVRPQSTQSTILGTVRDTSGGAVVSAQVKLTNIEEGVSRTFSTTDLGAYLAPDLNPQTLWVDPNVVGIDLGITFLSAENLRSGRVWRWFSRSPEVRRGTEQVFQPS